MDIVSFTVRQGLAHPIQVSFKLRIARSHHFHSIAPVEQCLPVLVSLETSPESVVADSAFALHTVMHNKHSSHLNSKYLENARAAFAYQQTLDAEPSGESSVRDRDFPVNLIVILPRLPTGWRADCTPRPLVLSCARQTWSTARLSAGGIAMF
jgi:cohesin loading factor subunit SCC2